MSFSSILDGSFVVWHANVAQIDIVLTTPLPSFNKIELIMGINRFNDDPHIKIYTKANPTAEYLYLTQLSSSVPIPILPIDGSFIEMTYAATFTARAVSNIRILITKDGVEPQRLTPVKKYVLYNNNAVSVGNSRYKINDLGWQTGEVFKTIFNFLSVPISPDRPVDLATETAGLLAESKISNDDLLARVADNEVITGTWDFANGQTLLERGTTLPETPNEGRVFYNQTTKNLYIGNGSDWIRFIREDDLAVFLPVTQYFDFTEPTTTVELLHEVNIDAPIWLTYETLPQQYGVDFIVTGNTLYWVNDIDTAMIGKMSIFYYRKLVD